MITNNIQYYYSVLMSIIVLCFSQIIYAESFYQVTIDTKPISGTNGIIVFDFIDGDAEANNSVTITEFTTDGLLGDHSSSGGTSGELIPGPVVLFDGEFFNEFQQNITFGDMIIFRMEISTSGSYDPAPDAISFFVLDSISRFPLDTTDPTSADAVFYIEINSETPDTDVYSSDYISATVQETSDPNSESDVSISVTDDPDPVQRNSNLLYTINITNNGPGLAQDVEVYDSLPRGVAVRSASTSQGTCEIDKLDIECELGDIGVGITEIVEIIVRPRRPGALRNTVTVESATSDPYTANNSDTEITTVLRE